MKQAAAIFENVGANRERDAINREQLVARIGRAISSRSPAGKYPGDGS